MKIFRSILAMGIASACTAAHDEKVTFVGQIDEKAYKTHYQSIPRDELQAECKSLTLSQTELLRLIETYEEVPSTLAYMTLIVTPCVIEDNFVFEGRAARFRWYPSGYLVIFYPGDEEAEGHYYICSSASGPEDESIITVEEIRRLRCE